jgi:hypothetical protein
MRAAAGPADPTDGRTSAAVRLTSGGRGGRGVGAAPGLLGVCPASEESST